MKNAIIIPNTLKQKSVDFAKIAQDFLKEKGYNATVCSNNDALPYDASVAVVLGGDGTILRASKRLYGKDIPILGINFGHLGYLSEVGCENAIEGLEALINGKYIIEERLMLEGDVVRNGESVFTFVSLNEATIYRSTLLHALKIEVAINGKSTETLSADGLILATPTGSTSYNLSAGGPVLTPTSNSIVITPVAPIFYPRSSIVTDGSDETEAQISFETVNETGAPCIEVDGDTRFALENGDIVKIRRAPHSAKIIKISDKSFYQILREKLSKGMQ